MTVQVLTGDCRDVLLTLGERSVQCVVTSPPFFGLRSYLPAEHADKAREIGTEQTPAAYVASLVAVFAQVKRVLRPDGLLWVELGDSYAAKSDHGSNSKQRRSVGCHYFDKRSLPGLSPKSLIGIPWRVAFALQDAGWILRSEIIWHRPNPMPESVQDRVTRSHSTIFMFAQQNRYYYDAVAIAEPAITADVRRPYTSNGAWERDGRPIEQRHGGQPRASSAAGMTRSARSVWSISTQPYSSGRDVDHFAVMPEKLVERCLLAGTSARGACVQCGSPWRRVVERTEGEPANFKGSTFTHGKTGVNGMGRVSALPRSGRRDAGWEKTCMCDCAETRPCMVLDPFGGSGTTAMVATKHGRDAILIDLNPAYAVLQDDRTSGVQMSLESVVL